MDMKRKVLLFTLLMAVVILLTEFLILDDYLPSVRPSKIYYEKLTQQYKREGRVHFASITRTRVRNKPVTTKQHAQAIARPAAVSIKSNRFRTGSNPQNRNMAMELSNKLMDEVNSLKSRKILNKTQIKLGGESKRVAQDNSRSQKRLTQTGDQGKSRTVRMENGKRVLIYTPLFHEIPWQGIRNSYEFTHYRGAPCPVTNCSLTYRRRLFSRSDVVIFHGQDMPDSYELEKLNRRRPKGQIWLYFVLENPSNARETYYFEDMFNWTMTYEKSADIFLPYGTYTALKPGEKSPYGVINPAKKDRLVVWTVSNCGGMRDWYVQELGNHIRVDIFGLCGGYVYQPDLQEDECEKRTPECENLIKRYKFQLAFENGNCIDYLTEKYWGTPLELGIVPVVLGGANYSQMAIPGSYINVLDFDSVKALADYLLYLDKNDTAYMEYFSWRKRYKVDGYLKASVFNDHCPWTCDICAKAQNPVSKRYKSLSDFRDSTTHCGLHEDKLYQMIRVGGDAGFGNQYAQQGDTYDEDENANEGEEDGDEEDGEEEDGDEEDGEEEDGDEEDGEEDGDEEEGEEEEKEDDEVAEDNEKMKGEEKGQNRDTRKVKVGELEQENSDKKKETKTGNEAISEKNKRSDKNKVKETETEDNEVVEDQEEKKGKDQREEKGQNSDTRKVKVGEIEQKHSDKNKVKETETKNEKISEKNKTGRDKNKEKETETEDGEVVEDKEEKKAKDQSEEKGQNSYTRKVKVGEIEQKHSDKNKEKESKTEDSEVVQDKEEKKGKDQSEEKGQNSYTRKVKVGEIEQKHSDKNKEKESKTEDSEVVQDKEEKKGKDQSEEKGQNSDTRKVKVGEIEQKHSDKNKEKESKTEDSEVVEDKEEKKGKDQSEEKGQHSDTRKVKVGEIEQKHSDKNKEKESKTEDSEVVQDKEEKKGKDQSEEKGQNSDTRKVKVGEIEQKHSDKNEEKESKTEDSEVVQDKEEKKGKDQREEKGQNSDTRKVKEGEIEQKHSDKNKEKEKETATGNRIKQA